MSGEAKDIKKQRSISLIIFVCCMFLYTSCFIAAYVLASRQAPTFYAMYIAFAAFVTCCAGVAGIMTALLADRKRNVSGAAYFTGLFGNILVVLIFLGMSIFSFLLKH